MSTLQCTNLQDTSGGNSLTTAQIYNGAAKAWVNFNGTGTVAIRAQFNVSSITDNSAGNYTINFTTSMPDANYCANYTTCDDNVASTYSYIQGTFGGSFTPTASSFRVYAIADGIGPSDRTINMISVFR